MALAGVGVDILEISRMEKTMKRTPAFVRRIFTDEERIYCERSPWPAQHYAGRFAAREAVLKALGTGFSQGIGLKDISVSRDKQGKPVANLSGKAYEIAKEKGVVEVVISISFTHEVAVANAVAVTEEARPKKDEGPSEKEKLQKTFKEACSILDELERVQEQSLDDMSCQE